MANKPERVRRWDRFRDQSRLHRASGTKLNFDVELHPEVIGRLGRKTTFP